MESKKSSDPIQAQSKLDSRKRARRFFYAEASAGLYDRTVELVVPKYGDLHDTALRLLRHSLLSEKSCNDRLAILDIGSGTGADSIALLREFPNAHVVAVDFCEAMQDEHRRRMKQLDDEGSSLSSRCSLVLGDVLGDLESADALLALLPRSHNGQGYSAVTTALTVHHFTHLEKMRFYRTAYEILDEHGVFLNADLFSYADRGVDELSLAHDLDWIRRQFDQPSEKFRDARALSRQRRSWLRDRWLYHYTHDNRCEPIEDPIGRPGQAQMLRDAGFIGISAPYRFFLSGILFAQKGSQKLEHTTSSEQR